MTSLMDCCLFHRAITLDDISKKPQCQRIKFKRAFQFLQLLLFQRVYGINVLTQSPRSRWAKQRSRFEVFLGGSCNPTTWRYELAIPFFQSHAISYYNPQVANWTPDLVEIEHQAKESAALLFFVIDHVARSLGAIAEVCYLAARGKNIIVVLSRMPREKSEIQFIQKKDVSNEEDNEKDYANVSEARRLLRILLRHANVPVFDNVRVALECAKYLFETTKQTETSWNISENEKIRLSVSSNVNHTIDNTLHPSKIHSSSSHREHCLTSIIHPTNSFSSFFRPRTSVVAKSQISSSTNESDDDGYGSLVSNDQTLSRSSSSISYDFQECASEHELSKFYILLSFFSHLFTSFSSSIFSINSFRSTANPFPAQSLPLLCTYPFQLIKDIFLPAPRNLQQVFHFELSTPLDSQLIYDLYIASGAQDDYWLNTSVLPTLDEHHIKYIKRPNALVNDPSDIQYSIHICKQSRLLYFLINGDERLSHLVTELAFLIGQRRYHIIVCLQSTINENSEKILSISERQDLERGRKYLEDLSKKENISLYQSREQSWEHVLTFFHEH